MQNSPLGYIAMIALVIPAIMVLARKGRRLLTCDIATTLMVGWMLATASLNPGSLSSPGAVCIEFLFSYIVGRAFFLRPAALDTFVRALKLITAFIVALAMGELVTGRLLAHEMAGTIFGIPPAGAVFRGGIIRATSTLDHPILLGVFCSLVNVIVLFWERSPDPTRTVFVRLPARMPFRTILGFANGVCFRNGGLWLRSAPAACTAKMDDLLECFRLRDRRGLLLSDHPIGWLISNLTLDPQSGYFRILIWNLAFERIELRPLYGYSFQFFNDPILDTTIDCVWLVNALRFGVPASALLFIVNLAAIWPIRQRGPGASDDYGQRMRLAFTAVLLLFMFSGITVHFWNYLWIFWGLCVGIRGALRESALNSGTARAAQF